MYKSKFKRDMKKFFVLLVISSISVSLSATENNGFAFPEIRGWKLKVSDEVYTPDNLWDIINGGAELYLNYGFSDLHIAEYKKKGGITVYVQAFHHNSLNNAYGIYSMEKSPEFEFINIGGEAYVYGDILNVFAGEYYIKLYTTDQGKNIGEDLKLIASQAVAALGQENTKPFVFGKFPIEGKLMNSEVYTIKDFLYQDFLTNAFSIDYNQGYKLFIIEGKDSKEILHMAAAYLKFTKQEEINPTVKSSFIIDDPDNGKIPVVISGQYLVGIVGDIDNENAKNGVKIIIENLNK
jgi:hypothetical protein